MSRAAAEFASTSVNRQLNPNNSSLPVLGCCSSNGDDGSTTASYSRLLFKQTSFVLGFLSVLGGSTICCKNRLKIFFSLPENNNCLQPASFIWTDGEMMFRGGLPEEVAKSRNIVSPSVQIKLSGSRHFLISGRKKKHFNAMSSRVSLSTLFLFHCY